MKELRNIILIGAGAVGVLPGAKLCRTPGVFLRVLADAERVARYRRDGIFFNDERLDFHYLAPGEEPEFRADLALIATKSGGLDDALALLENRLAPGAVILPLLNGISARDRCRRTFPEATTLYGFFLGHASGRIRNRITHEGAGKFYFGGDDDAAASVKALFDRAGITAEVPEDIVSAMWCKFVLNVGINQTQAIYRADYGTVQKSQEMMAFCKELMAEAVAVARAYGVANTETMADSALRVIVTMPPDAKTSMLQDVLAGRTTEVDLFAGTLCAMAEAKKVPVPANQRVLDQLSCR